MYKRDFLKFTMEIFLYISILFAALYFREIYFHNKSMNYGSSYFYPKIIKPAMKKCGVHEPMDFYAQNALVLYLVDSSENWKHVSEDDVRTVFRLFMHKLKNYKVDCIIRESYLIYTSSLK